MVNTKYPHKSTSRCSIHTVSHYLNYVQKKTEFGLIRNKIKELLAKNDLEVSSYLKDNLRRLLDFYTLHEETTPIWNDLCLYDENKDVF